VPAFLGDGKACVTELAGSLGLYCSEFSLCFLSGFSTSEAARAPIACLSLPVPKKIVGGGILDFKLEGHVAKLAEGKVTAHLKFWASVLKFWSLL
jgi:hypothetical protein